MHAVAGGSSLASISACSSVEPVYPCLPACVHPWDVFPTQPAGIACYKSGCSSPESESPLHSGLLESSTWVACYIAGPNPLPPEQSQPLALAHSPALTPPAPVHAQAPDSPGVPGDLRGGHHGPGGGAHGPPAGPAAPLPRAECAHHGRLPAGAVRPHSPHLPQPQPGSAHRQRHPAPAQPAGGRVCASNSVHVQACVHLHARAQPWKG